MFVCVRGRECVRERADVLDIVFALAAHELHRHARERERARMCVSVCVREGVCEREREGERADPLDIVCALAVHELQRDRHTNTRECDMHQLHTHTHTRTHMDESCTHYTHTHTHGWMSHNWVTCWYRFGSQRTRTLRTQTHAHTHTNESCTAYTHTHTHTHTQTWIFMNQSCVDIIFAVGAHALPMNESCHAYKWVMSQIWMSHVTHMNASCLTYEWIMSHIWMSQVTHMNESCHTQDWVIAHVRIYHVTQLTSFLLSARERAPEKRLIHTCDMTLNLCDMARTYVWRD